MFLVSDSKMQFVWHRSKVHVIQRKNRKVHRGKDETELLYKNWLIYIQAETKTTPVDTDAVSLCLHHSPQELQMLSWHFVLLKPGDQACSRLAFRALKLRSEVPHYWCGSSERPLLDHGGKILQMARRASRIVDFELNKQFEYMNRSHSPGGFN